MSSEAKIKPVAEAPANPPELRPVAKRVVTIAVAGNPNAGKSTLINAIAGSRLHVGNWPGVTVEKKEATSSSSRVAESAWSISPAPIPSPPTPRKRSSPATIWSTRSRTW